MTVCNVRTAAGAVVHLAAFLNYVFGIHYQLTRDPIPEEMVARHPLLAGIDKFPGQWKYLTFWNMFIQLAFCVLCLVNDVTGGRSRRPRVRLVRLEDFFFASVAFPVGIFVGLIFWGLYFSNKDLIYPHPLEIIIPDWLNHAMHTTVLPLQFYELVFGHHERPSKRRGAAATVAFCAIYLSWVVVVAKVGGYWVYPVLEVLNPIQRVAFLVLCSFFSAALYLFGHWTNGIISGGGTEEATEGHRKRKPKKN